MNRRPVPAKALVFRGKSYLVSYDPSGPTDIKVTWVIPQGTKGRTIWRREAPLGPLATAILKQLDAQI